MNSAASTARSRSASSKTMTGFLPPSSKCTRFSVGAPCAMMSEPVADSPTKPMALIAGCSVSALPASSPRPCTRLSTPAGSTSLGDLREQHRRERAPFGGLVHDRAAGGERRRDLPGRQHERRVPGRDHAHGADRLADRVVELALGRQREAVPGARRAVGEEAEILGRAQRRLRHVAERLAGIHALDEGDLVGAGDDLVGDLVQQRLALPRRSSCSRPGRRGPRPWRRGRCRRPGRARSSPAACRRPAKGRRRSAPEPASALPSIQCGTGPDLKRAR